ncbi:MAG TPA: PEP-CTERM sorting domain-containing protein [Pyrinomonadaceae bacterium]|nr:PEP-CTERM sorting domain-containing protein [Pyrinomonadaceae bacterium]
MKKLLVSLAALFVLSIPAAVKADTLTFTPSPSDLGDLDHHRVYAWRIGGVNLNGQVITGARITFKNIRNWDNRANTLFVHLLDTAKVSGVSSFIDDTRDRAQLTDAQLQASMIDDFANTRFHNQSSWLLNSGTADTFLFSRSFPTTGQNFVYNFTAGQLQALMAYIANDGRFALGFDPDCHFFNDGIVLEIFTASAPVPEPATMALLSTGLAGLYYRRRRQRRRESNLEA